MPVVKAQQVPRPLVEERKGKEKVHLRLIEDRMLGGRMLPHEWDPVEQRWVWSFATTTKKPKNKKKKEKLRKKTIAKLRKMLGV